MFIDIYSSLIWSKQIQTFGSTDFCKNRVIFLMRNDPKVIINASQ